MQTMFAHEYLPSEQRAIERHRARLSQEWGREVNFEEAAAHWETHEAAAWRQQRQVEMLRLQREEIERHKWIQSEKAQRDLGREAALEWIRSHAEGWRKWFEETYQ